MLAMLANPKFFENIKLDLNLKFYYNLENTLMKNGLENGYYHEITPSGFGIAKKAGKLLYGTL